MEQRFSFNGEIETPITIEQCFCLRPDDKIGSRSIRIAQAVKGLHAKCSYRANLEPRGSVMLARS